MKDKQQRAPAAKGEQRREQFAPHESPKRQPDGDPGPNSARDGAKKQSGPETPEPVEDEATQD